jgi:hypothetical protein
MPEARADDLTAGGLLADRRAEILTRLEARLRESGSLLGKDPAVLPECLARADAILTATVTDLARPAPPVQPQEQSTPPGGTGVLMDVVLAELLRFAAEQPRLVPDLAAATPTTTPPCAPRTRRVAANAASSPARCTTSSATS